MRFHWCPRCGRDVYIQNRRYNRHCLKAGGDCGMSYQRIPVSGMTPRDFEERAKIVAELASEVQDADPRTAWGYLTCLDEGELRRLLMVAFAAIPTDQTLAELFRWVSDLPAVKESA